MIPDENKEKWNCKKNGHQYTLIDEKDPYGNYGYSAIASTAPSSSSSENLRTIYGGQFVKHIFCSKCGEYRNVSIKSEKGLEGFLDMEKLKQ